MRAHLSKRSGFALLATLWLITALSVIGGVGVAIARTGSQTTRNRILLARSGWAREACVEILLARFARDAAVREVPRVDLGRGTWCRAQLDDPSARLNVNEADSTALDRLIGRRERGDGSSLLGEILSRRRHGALVDLGEVPGLERFADLLTIRGTGAVNINAAPIEVLRTIPGLGEEAVQVILTRRVLGHPLQSADDLAGLLSRPARTLLLAEYMEFLRATVFAPAQLVAAVEGGVSGTPITARATITVVPVPERLAVIRREVE